MKKKILITVISLIAVLAIGVGVFALLPEQGPGSIKPVQYTIQEVYAEAQTLGFSGSLEDFLAVCKGEQGASGKSAYELAVENGYQGTQEEWLNSLNGAEGKNAYDIAVQNGYQGTQEQWLNSLVGNGILSVEKTNTENNTDTYTVNFTNGTNMSFSVINGVDGNGILSIEKTNTSGNLDVYTIYFTNGESTTFSVTNGIDGVDGKDGVDGTDGKDGKEITSITKSSTNGLVDTYNVLFNDGSYQNIKVTNGKDGVDGTDGKDGVDGKDGKDGVDGKTVEFRVEGEWLQWKYTDESDAEWKNLYETTGTPAPDGLVKISFTLNGGAMPTGTPSSIDVTAGTEITLPTPTKRGYTFMGWYLNTNDAYPVTSPYRAHESQRLIAVWKAGAVITGTKIYNMNDLAKINNNLSGTYVLMNNINMQGLALPAIGPDSANAFRGIFEGQGYTISNFVASPANNVGLFGYNTGTIRNLQIADFDLTLQTCANSDTVSAGGIVGYNAGTIENCTVKNGSVEVSVTNYRRAGLIAGGNSGKIINCFALGRVTLSQPSTTRNYARAGGITGINQDGGQIENCIISAYVYSYSYGGNLSGPHPEYGVSGLVCAENFEKSTVKNCIVLGVVEGGNHSKGDVCAKNDGTITNCYKADNIVITNPTHTYATPMSSSQLSSYNFYSITLGWDSAVWNFNNINLGENIYPSLIYNF